MDRWKYLALLLIATSLSSCAIEPRSQADREAKENAYYAALGDKCRRFGFQPGTDGFADCVRQEDICEKRRQSAALDYNLALIREGSKPGSRYLSASERAAQQTNLAGRLCR